MKLYFVRHGQTDANAKAVKNQNSGNDEPLNEHGVHKSENLAKELKSVQFDAIITSPFRRCVQTAEILARSRGIKLTVDESWEEIHTNGYIDFDTWVELCTFGSKTAIENIEPLEDFFNRIYGAIETLIEKNKDKTVLLVSHGGVQHALYAYANNTPLKGDVRISPMRNCEYRMYEF